MKTVFLNPSKTHTTLSIKLDQLYINRTVAIATSTNSQLNIAISLLKSNSLLE